jgi:nucleotide-binding universal stress UspA family protein
MSAQKILVTLDHSSQAPIVFEAALGLAQKQHSQLRIFHCLDWEAEEKRGLVGIGTLGDVDVSGAALGHRRDFLARHLKEAQDLLQPYYQEAISRNIPTEITCQAGNPGFRICHLARNWGADLIVIGRRGYQGLSEIFLGSVSNYVIHHAPCSVLVVQK